MPVVAGGADLALVPSISRDYAERMYAIAFDLDTKALEEHYPKRYPTQAYGEIKAALAKRGFSWQQGSVYFGNETVNAVTTVLAVQEVAKELPWLSKVVRDIRMLRIEENNDLSTALPNMPEVSKPESLLDALDGEKKADAA